MDDKKNFFIGALIVLLLISAVWGQKETGQRKMLAKENTALHAQLQAADDAVKNEGELRAEAARQKEARQQAEAKLDNARKKIEELQGKLAELAEQEKALAVLKAEKDKTLAAAGAQQKVVHEQLAQQQAVLEAQEQKLASAAKVIEEEQRRIKACDEKTKECEQLRASFDELDAANKQLEEERNKVLTEAETLRAQVIGLEKIVEERSSALAKAEQELENCKINNNVLIGQIAQQQVKPDPKKCPIPPLKSKAEQQFLPAAPIRQAVPQQEQQALPQKPAVLPPPLLPLQK